MEVGKKSENLPPGFRFHPTDEELITYYLMNKILDPNFTGKAITDVDLNRSEPWDLPEKAKMGEKEWYFFSLRDRKYPTGVRTNRATNSGYWKTTGKDKEILNSSTLEPVGMKKTLVFYKGRAPRGEKTSWVIHEYRHLSKSTGFKISKDEWVVCRVFQKTSTGKKCFSNHSHPNLSPTSSSSSMAALTTNYLHDDPYQRGLHGRNYTSTPRGGGSSISSSNVDVYPSTVMILDVDNDNHPVQHPTPICTVRQLQGFTFPASAAPFVVQPPPVDQGGGGLIQSMEQCVELDRAFWPALLS